MGATNRQNLSISFEASGVEVDFAKLNESHFLKLKDVLVQSVYSNAFKQLIVFGAQKTTPILVICWAQAAGSVHYKQNQIDFNSKYNCMTYTIFL